MWQARLRSHQKSGKRVLLVTAEIGIRGLFAHLGTYEDMLVANNTNLNDRSTTSLAGA